MASKRIHFWGRGHIVPQGVCGTAWLAQVTRRPEHVTCRRCRKRMALAATITKAAATGR